jgi:DDE_Tnp_1-associated
VSTPSRAERRRELKQQKAEVRRAQRELQERQKAEGLKRVARTTIVNGKSEWKTVEEEKQARQEAVEEQLRVFRHVLPTLLERLDKIPDPRNPKTSKHKLTVVMLYGIVAFVFQMTSRREANREMTMPQFQENLKLLFPELDSTPHQDTLNRLLGKIPVDQIQDTLVELIARFIRNKKFCRYLVSNRYAMVMDGTQKLVRNHLWAEECLERQVQHKDKDGTLERRPQYYVYVLEANFAFPNGITIPLMSEFLSYTEGDQASSKQDCELKAFKRLAEKIKKRFPRLPIQILLDGLYPNGPVMELCRHYHWQFMIVLQDDALPSVWEEVRGLEKLQTGNRFQQNWGDRRQRFRWVNGIEYRWGPQDRKRQVVHVVICEESWEEIDADTAETEQKTSRHVWISSETLNRGNVHERCNLTARHRWAIENSILIEKHHGYQYQHLFSQNWNAMRGYHFLMRLGHLINVLAQNTARLMQIVRHRGVRGLIQLIRDTCKGPWLDSERIRQLIASSPQLRLE